MTEYEQELTKLQELDELRHQGKNIPLQHEEEDWEDIIIRKVDKENER